MNADAHLERRRATPLKFSDRRLHSQTCPYRPHRIIFAGLPSAEHSHDGITNVFFRDSAIRGDDFIQPLPDVAHEIPNVLGITFVNESSKALEVREQNG